MPFYQLKLADAEDGAAKMVVTASGFPEVRLSVADEDEALSAGRDAIKQALAQRRVVGEPIPEPLAVRPGGALVVEVLDDWLMKDTPAQDDRPLLDKDDDEMAPDA